MHTADANARNYSTFSRASAPDADADVALAIRLHEAGCERAAAAVLSGAAYDADAGADRRERRALRKWRRKCAAWRAQAEERIEREEEAASSRKLDPITPIELCEDGPAAGDPGPAAGCRRRTAGCWPRRSGARSRPRDARRYAARVATVLASGVLSVLAFALGWYARGRFCACGAPPAVPAEV